MRCSIWSAATALARGGAAAGAPCSAAATASAAVLPAGDNPQNARRSSNVRCARKVRTPRFFKSDRRCLVVSTDARSEEHTSELQSRENLVCRLLLEKKNLIMRQ